MTKRITTLLIALMCCGAGFAQKTEVRRLEGEIGIGLVNGVNSLTLDNCATGPKLYGELRYNFRMLPIDVGMQVSGSYFWREAESQPERLKSRSYNVMAVADYNLFRGRRVSLFAGVGVGLGVLSMSHPIDIKNPDAHWAGYSTGEGKNKPCFSPRVGVELFNHLRLTVHYMAEEKANNHFGFSIGGVIGGGRKR
ncbi:MAG: hypothetical protein J6C45_06920 [Alistipes sp.]|nr:hypothetical protein [Alistipes sp.]MBO5276575.1 hypothetical protein [Alistipes sp.]